MVLLTCLVEGAQIQLATPGEGSCAIRHINGGLVFTCNETETSDTAARLAALEAKVDGLDAKLTTLLRHFGYEPPPSQPPSMPPCTAATTTVASCTASSEHSSSYSCDNAFDGAQAAQGSANDAGIAWATRGEGVGSWIEATFAQPVTINTMMYANRDAHASGSESNRDVRLTFSDGSYADVAGISAVGSSTHAFPATLTSTVRVTVRAVHGAVNNGAEEITFSNTCP